MNYTFYKIVSKNKGIPDSYIGHTVDLYRRKKEHRKACNMKNSDSNSYVYKMMREKGGWANWEFLVLEQRVCANKEEACKIEESLITLHSPTMNRRNPITNRKLVFISPVSKEYFESESEECWRYF